MGYLKNTRRTKSLILKGKHAFFVCTHTDKKHIHNHIYWNAVTLDCKHKFRDHLGSWRSVARLSDLICLEHQLSVVNDPKRYTPSHYGKWLGGQAKVSHRELARSAIYHRWKSRLLCLSSQKLISQRTFVLSGQLLYFSPLVLLRQNRPITRNSNPPITSSGTGHQS